MTLEEKILHASDVQMSRPVLDFCQGRAAQEMTRAVQKNILQSFIIWIPFWPCPQQIFEF